MDHGRAETARIDFRRGESTQVRMEFVYEGGGLGKAGTATLYVDGKKVGEGRIERTHAFLFSMDETMDVGRDVGGSVSKDYDAKGSGFNGQPSSQYTYEPISRL
jgi:hypothetical protein